MVILDTNIIIDHLRQPPGTSVLTDLLSRFSYQDLKFSLLTLQELYAGTSTKVPQKEKDLLATISQFEILPYTYEIAKLAGEIMRDLNHSIELADAAIAATALINNCELATLNRKDFAGISELSLFPLEY